MRDAWRNPVSAEWYKLRRNDIFLVLTFLMVTMAVSFVLITYWSMPKSGGFRIDLTGMELYARSLAINQFLLKLLLGILAGFYIAAEYATGVLKRTVSAGSGRGSIFASKLAVFAFGVVLLLLWIPVLTVMLGGVLTGVGLLPAFGGPEDVPAAAYVLRTVGFTVLFGAAFASIAACIAVILADNGKTIGLSLIFFLFVDQVLLSLGQHVPLIKTIYDYSLFKLYATTIQYRMDGGDLLLSIVVPIATIAAFSFVGVRVFRRQEIR